MGVQIPGYDSEPRHCGGCHACCIALQIDHLNKPRHVRCPELTEYQGCAHYDQRGDVCRRFQCLWSLGALGVGNRPDKLGILLQLFELPDGTPILGATELWPGAFDGPLAIWALGALIPGIGLCARITYEGRSSYTGRPELVNHAVDLERAAREAKP